MTKEIEIAYPRLVREWRMLGGRSTRLNVLGHKGIPDFFMAHRDTGAVLCEVKCVQMFNSPVGLEHAQAEFLDGCAEFNVVSRVLVLCLDLQEWGIFDAGRLLFNYHSLKYKDATRFNDILAVKFMLGEKLT